MRPRRSVVDHLVPGEPAPPRTLVRLRVIGALAVVAFSVMFVRLWYLQVLDSKGFTQAVTANQVRNVEIPAPRGLILDRTGQATLVGNQYTEDITLSRVSAQQHPEVLGALSALLGVTPQQIQADLSNPQFSLYKPVPILENAPMTDVLYIDEHPSEFPGVSAVTDTNRSYPLCPTNPPGACQTGVQMLGYVGQITSSELNSHKTQGYQLGDQFGQTGLENQYEGALRGKPGVKDVEVDAQGQVVGTVGQSSPQSGYDLVTNIDAGLEQNLQQDLDSEITTLHSSSGAAVVLDPQTGAVLALASYPTYNPAWWTPNGITSSNYQQLQSDGSLNDWAIDGLYTPGSTFKLATATAALQDGLITPGFTFYDPGFYTLGNTTFHDALGEHPGSIGVSTAITVSSDDFFYNLGVMFWNQRDHYGQDAIENAANSLGYGVLTGIDLPGENPDARVDSPQVVAKEHAQDPAAYPDGNWYAGSNLELAFGQGGTVITPVEQAVAYSTFANGGTRYAPEVAAGLVNPVNCKVVKRFAPRVMGHVTYTPGNYQAMLTGFQGAVDDPTGTAYPVFQNFPLSQFPIAGKTGTASVSGQQPNSWFVGFGPLPSSRYVITAVIQGGGYGEAAAAPVVANAFKYLMANPAPQTSLAAPAGSCSSAVASTTSASRSPAATHATTSAFEAPSVSAAARLEPPHVAPARIHNLPRTEEPATQPAKWPLEAAARSP